MSNWLPIKTLINDSSQIGNTLTVKGWLRSKRDSKAGISFLTIHDGTSFDPIQAVVPNTLDNYESEVLGLSTGCAVDITGELVQSKGRGQSVEILASNVVIVGQIDDPETYPIAKKRHTFEYLRSVAHLRTRTNTFSAITRIRHLLANAIHGFFHREGFYWVNTPIITANDCEGAGELFRVSTLDFTNLPHNSDGSIDNSQDFFGNETFLTVSGQLAVESHCLSMSKVYTFGPTFRAENSHTSRHLAEFWMVEPEIAFADLNDNAALAERLLQHVIYEVLKNCEDDIAFFQQRIDNTVLDRLNNIVSSNFERMTYTHAINFLENCNESFEHPIHWGIDMASEHERYLTEKVGRPIVVTDYPKDIKAFYMRLNDDDKTVAAMDILVPGIGEIIGGSQREERLNILDSRMNEPLKKDLWWYRDLRRYGTVPHAGFGLGFERLLAYVTGMENVRDVIPFPRTPGHATF